MHHLRAILILMSILGFVIYPTDMMAIESDLVIATKWSGDFDGMADRHLIRALVPPSKTFYFLDGADQRGLTYELLKEFETHLNKKLKRKALKIRLVVIPTRRDRLLPALAALGIEDATPPATAVTALAMIYALVPCVFKLTAIAMVSGLPITQARQAAIATRLLRRDTG